ncbi:PqiC family protein [Puniceicoccaceae bacterium K14]|nr:PqiC family protein [Puniceicoccaceae bacterium K14]
MRLLINIIILLGLTACSTTIPNVSYYKLPETEARLDSNRLEVTSIKLPDYIDHKDVVLELDDGTLHRANFHKWAENLDDGIVRLLEGSKSEGVSTLIELMIVQFHGLESGRIKLSGKWRKMSGDKTLWKSFDMELSVTKSGYVNMIEAQAKLIEELRSDIVSSNETDLKS